MMKRIVLAAALVALAACNAKQPARGNSDVTTVATDNVVVKDVPVREPTPKVQP